MQLYKELEESSSWTMTVRGMQNARDCTLTRTYALPSFRHAMMLVNMIAEIAEAEDHHPDISIEKYQFVKLTITTHAAKSLTENDFIVAAKCDAARAAMAQQTP